MGHDHHFLERLDRVAREETEFALALYRDHEAVRHLLTRVRLPESADRIALALGDSREGPFVIVTRDGHFVTCLGKGMKPGPHPIVPRAQIDAQLAKVRDLRARREMLERELRPGEEDDDLIERIYTRKNLLTREELLGISVFQPLLAGEFLIALVKGGTDVIVELRTLDRAIRAQTVGALARKVLEASSRVLWGAAHSTVLAAMGERDTFEPLTDTLLSAGLSPSWPSFLTGIGPFWLRGLWASARFGKVILPIYKAGLTGATTIYHCVDAVGGMVTIALSHASARAEVEKTLGAQLQHEGAEDPLLAARAAYSEIGLSVLEAATALEGAALKVGRTLYFERTRHLPEGDPRRPASADEVSDDLARPAVLNERRILFDNPQASRMAFALLPLVSRATAEAFYFPRDVVNVAVEPWTWEDTRDWARTFADSRTASNTPARSQSVGRNDPCPCGSGKKSKKCCGR